MDLHFGGLSAENDRYDERKIRYKRTGEYMKKRPNYPTWEVKDFRELLDGVVAKYALNTAFLWRDEDADDGIFQKTYAELGEDVRDLATYLCALGLEGKTVAVTGQNSYLWMVAYLAVVCGCGTVLPLDRDLRGDELLSLMLDAECAAVLYTEDMEIKIHAMGESHVLCIPLASAEHLFARGAELRAEGSTVYEEHVVDPFATGILLYTSGTVGVAKGVMLSQNNICSNIVSVCKRFRVEQEDRALSHLPLHHTYECMSNMVMLYNGASIAFNENMRHMPGDMVLFQPTILVTVPAVLEFMSGFVRKGYAEARGGRILLGVQKVASAVMDGTVRHFSEKRSHVNKRKIFSTVNHFFGGSLRAILVGAAALSPQVFHMFEQFGYAVYCGHGLTETSPISLMHDDHYRHAEDVGFPVPGVEIRIDNPNENGIGELCVKGPNVMLGYYKKAEETAEVLKDGWLYTGDLGMATKNGGYRIVGRKKSMIVVSNGKKVFPEELEAYFMQYPIIAECLVFSEEAEGHQRLCVSVYPNFSEAESMLGLGSEDERFSSALKEKLLSIVREVNFAFPQYKHIRKLVIRKNEFSKTTTEKIQRGIPENLEENSVTCGRL